MGLKGSLVVFGRGLLWRPPSQEHSRLSFGNFQYSWTQSKQIAQQCLAYIRHYYYKYHCSACSMLLPSTVLMLQLLSILPSLVQSLLLDMGLVQAHTLDILTRLIPILKSNGPVIHHMNPLLHVLQILNRDSKILGSCSP